MPDSPPAADSRSYLTRNLPRSGADGPQEGLTRHGGRQGAPHDVCAARFTRGGTVEPAAFRLRSSTSSYIAASFRPSESNDSSRSKCARTAARVSGPDRAPTARIAAHRASGSSHAQSLPTAPLPVSERKDGMSVTTGGSPQASASIKEYPLP